ncbi:DUF6284 family protein [Streptomyces jumonjinensis]|uniref:DUF6284 family protein n=1 Tax=Streptomyces jumonjinensis TaxID=1945 RepID=UPI0037BD572A
MGIVPDTTASDAVFARWLEPSDADLDAIAAEMPLIEAEIAVLDAEISALDRMLSEIDVRRIRRARRRVLASRLALTNPAPGTTAVAGAGA